MKKFLLIFTIIVLSSMLVPAFALEEFHSSEFGFSIKYPENWHVDDETFDLGEMAGFDEGFWSIVYFVDDPDFVTDSIEVTFVKSDNIAKNNQGQKYVDRVESRLAENCEILIMETDGVECSNFLVTDTEITEHKGLPAYKITQTWIESYPDGTSLELKSQLMDIVDGNDVWTIDGISIKSEFPKFANTLEAVMESFSLVGSEDSGQKIPSWVKNTMEWYVDGLISEDEMISAIQYLVNEGIIKLK